MKLHGLPDWLLFFVLLPAWYLFYCTRGINIAPIVIVFLLYRSKIWERVGAFWGKREARDAFALTLFAICIYSVVMLCFHVENTMSALWGDSSRVVEDFTMVEASHYRAKTHPLYILICQTAYHLIAPAGGTNGAFLRMMILVFAAINVGLFSLFASKISKSRVASVGSGLILMFSYPMLYQGAMMVESFIFSQTTVLACMLYFQHAYREQRYSMLPLMALAVITAGINLGYAVIFGIMYCVLLGSCGMGWRQAIRNLLVFALVFLVVFNVLMLVQYYFYGQGAASSRLPKTLIQALLSTAEEDVLYLNKNFSASFFIGEYVPGYLRTALYWRAPPLLPEKSEWWTLLWSLLVPVSVVLIRKVEQRRLLTSLIAVNVFLLAFHSVYGYAETPLYGPIISVALLSLLPFSFSVIEGVSRARIALACLVCALVFSELVVNVPGMMYNRRISDIYFPAGVNRTYEELVDLAGKLSEHGDSVPEICDSLDTIEGIDESCKLGSEIAKGVANGDMSLENVPVSVEVMYGDAFSFGLENRRKLIFQDGLLTDLKTGDVVFDGRGMSAKVEHENYRVVLSGSNGAVTTISEDENGVYLNGRLIEGTGTPLDMPDFRSYRYPTIMKTLYHEIMFQIIDGVPYARLRDIGPAEWGRPVVFYRDAAMVGLFLDSIGRVDAIEGWIRAIGSMYDINRGVAEPDNLGQVLYLQSLLPEGERNQALIGQIVEEARRISDEEGNLLGTTDGARTSAYQNGWLLFGLDRLGMSEEAGWFNGCSDIDENGYKELLWFTLSGDNAEGAQFEKAWERDGVNEECMVDNDRYPYLTVAKNHYNLLAGGVVEPPVISSILYPLSWGDDTRPHIWHAVELYMYFSDLERLTGDH